MDDKSWSLMMALLEISDVLPAKKSKKSILFLGPTEEEFQSLYSPKKYDIVKLSFFFTLQLSVFLSRYVKTEPVDLLVMLYNDLSGMRLVHDAANHRGCESYPELDNVRIAAVYTLEQWRTLPPYEKMKAKEIDYPIRVDEDQLRDTMRYAVRNAGRVISFYPVPLPPALEDARNMRGVLWENHTPDELLGEFVELSEKQSGK